MAVSSFSRCRVAYSPVPVDFRTWLVAFFPILLCDVVVIVVLFVVVVLRCLVLSLVAVVLVDFCGSKQFVVGLFRCCTVFFSWYFRAVNAKLTLS